MLDNILQVIFLVGLVVYLFAVHGPNVRRYRKSRITDSRLTRLDLALDMLAFVAWQVAPVIFVLTPWLDFADYRLPTRTGWVGTAIFALALWLLWRSYADLGRNWSPTLQIMEEHSLLTHGVYCYVRHPIYAALWLWAIAQPLLLQNWIAGFALLVIFIPLYLLRVPREEQMMLEHFREQYNEYMSHPPRHPAPAEIAQPPAGSQTCGRFQIWRDMKWVGKRRKWTSINRPWPATSQPQPCLCH